jgi:ABC-2 type transport system permease protein
MAIWALAKKETVLLVRDWRAAVLLLLLPLLFILILGLLLGEAFGQKPDDRIRFMIVDLDRGPVDPKVDVGSQKATTWAQVVRNDLAETAEIRIEVVDSEDEARRLVAEHKQAAVLIFKPDFSARISHCSFLTDGINPFYRDGVVLDKVDAELLSDDKQPGQAAIIQQVAQVALLRVILPYMIGKAFLKLSEEKFIKLLGEKVSLPVPPQYRLFIGGKDKLTLEELLERAAEGKPATIKDYQKRVGSGVQDALREQFKKYELTGMTWARLTRAQDDRAPFVLAAGTVGLLGSPRGQGPLLAVSALTPGRPDLPRGSGVVSRYENKEGSGLLHRGAYRYQLLVPSYTVMFAFFLVMTVGWLFTSERRQGTLKRLRAAPLTRGQILLGKLLPCFALSLLQGILLLLAGKLVFGMRWGPDSWSLGEQILWLLPVVFTTSLAAMGLAVLVAALARTEVQVALYGAVPALVLALIGGCVLPREMMPEQTQVFTLFTPQGWALDAYRELLVSNPNAVPNLAIVAEACGVLAGFGAAFLALAWWLLPLE